MVFFIYSLLVSWLLLFPCLALICYENDIEKGIVEAPNSNWSYCAFIPPMKNETAGRVFGVSAFTDSTDNYDSSFATNDVAYSILTICFLERYGFGEIVADKRLPPEFLLRCVCNYDRCNSAVTMDTYLLALKADSI